jgi:hypothetical protein
MKVLQKCSDEEGDTLLGTAFGYSSWKAVFSTPSVMLDKKMFRGVPMNITAGLSQLRRAISSWSNLLIFRCRIVRSSEVADFSCGRRSIEPEHDRHQFLR